MKKIMLISAIMLAFLAIGCVQKSVEKIEATYYCVDHPYCKVAEKYLRSMNFLKLDYCNLSDIGNCSSKAKQNMQYIFTIPTVIYENKTFNGLFGVLEFMKTLKREGYKVRVPKTVDVVKDIEEDVKAMKSKNSTLFIKYLEEFKSNISKTRVYFFYSPTCPHCMAVEPFVESLTNKTNITFCNVNDMRNCSIDTKIVMTFSGLRGVPTAVVVNSTSAEVLEGEEEVKELGKYV